VVDALGVVDEHAKPFLACQLESQHFHTWYRGLDEARYVTLKLSFLLELSRCHCEVPTPINKNGRRAPISNPPKCWVQGTRIGLIPGRSSPGRR
jgi:hypothetical protein